MTRIKQGARALAPIRPRDGARWTMAHALMLAPFLGLAPLATAPMAMAQTAGAPSAPGQAQSPVCLTRISDPDMIAMPGDHALTAWLTVREPVVVSIRASGFADGDTLGRLSVSVLQDGMMLARSSEARGTGKLDAGVTATASLMPGRQYRFVARPDSRDTQLRQLRLHIVSDASCG